MDDTIISDEAATCCSHTVPSAYGQLDWKNSGMLGATSDEGEHTMMMLCTWERDAAAQSSSSQDSHSVSRSASTWSAVARMHLNPPC